MECNVTDQEPRTNSLLLSSRAFQLEPFPYKRLGDLENDEQY